MATTEEVAAWSKTAADNNDADAGINWSEGQTPGSVNNSARGMMAAIAKWRDDQAGQLTTGGTANVQTLTTNQGIDALADGIRVHFVASLSNTGAATLNVDGLGAKALRKFLVPGSDAALTGFEILKDGHYIAEYDASANAAAGAWIVLNPNQPPTRGELFGLTLSNNGSDAVNDIDIAAGACADSTNVVRMVLASALTKRIDAAWAVGTGNGGLDGTESSAGTPDTSTWYHVWLIMRSDTGVVDALFSESATSPTMPTNYDYKRRIGAVYNGSGGDIAAFTQRGDQFRLTTEVTERSGTSQSTWAQLTLVSVPTGVRVRPLLTGAELRAGSGAGIVATEFADGDQPSTPTAIVKVMSTAFVSDRADWAYDGVITDTSARIWYRIYVVSGSPSITANSIISRGWIDERGRLA